MILDYIGAPEEDIESIQEMVKVNARMRREDTETSDFKLMLYKTLAVLIDSYYKDRGIWASHNEVTNVYEFEVEDLFRIMKRLGYDLSDLRLLSGDVFYVAYKEGETEPSILSNCTIRKYVPIRNTPRSSCFITTAAYGSEFAEELNYFRSFRDSFLYSNAVGSTFVRYYYSLSPMFSELIARSERRRKVVRMILDKILSIIKKTDYSRT